MKFIRALSLEEKDEGKDVVLTDDEMQLLTETSGEAQSNLSEQLETNDKLFLLQAAIESLIELKRKNPGVSVEGFSHVASMAAVGTIQDPKEILDPSLSLEALASHRDGAIQKMFHGIGNALKSISDDFKYMVSHTSGQISKLKKIQKLLTNAPAGPVTLKLNPSNFLHYGHDQKVVTNRKDYIEHLKQVAGTLSKMTENLNKLSSSDWFFELKGFLNADNLATPEFAKEFGDKKVKIVASLFDTLFTSLGVKKEMSKKDYDIYATDVLLGLYQIEIYKPTEPTNVAKYGLHTERLSQTFKKDKILIEFAKSDIEEILKICESLLNDAKQLNDFVNRWEALSPQWAKIINQLQSKSNPATTKSIIMEFITSSGQMMNMISRVMHDSLRITFNISFGNAKAGLAISEKYLTATKSSGKVDKPGEEKKEESKKETAEKK